jgi:hypothetical protein
LREIQAAVHKDFFEPIYGVVQVMLQHASSSYLQLLAAMRERVKINIRSKKKKTLKETMKNHGNPEGLDFRAIKIRS